MTGTCGRCGKENRLLGKNQQTRKWICRSCATSLCPSQKPENRRNDPRVLASSKAYYITPIGKAHRAWNNLKSRCEKQKSYKEVHIMISKNKFIRWFLIELTKWEKLHPNKKPSVDRINNDGDYEIGNIQLLELKVNRLKSSRCKNINGNCPEGMKWCPSCQAYVSKEEFYQVVGDRTTSKCRPCLLAKYRKEYEDKHGRVLGVCDDCGIQLPVTESGKISFAKRCGNCKQKHHLKRKHHERIDRRKN